MPVSQTAKTHSLHILTEKEISFSLLRSPRTKEGTATAAAAAAAALFSFNISYDEGQRPRRSKVQT